VDPKGDDPFQEWLDQLKDTRTVSRILVRLHRVEHGDFGEWSSIGSGVCELKFDFGPGYRVYYGMDNDDLILLGGGSKKQQSSDIRKATERWEDYNA
jgi:putative addiction module killer protein